MKKFLTKVKTFRKKFLIKKTYRWEAGRGFPTCHICGALLFSPEDTSVMETNGILFLVCKKHQNSTS